MNLKLKFVFKNQYSVQLICLKLLTCHIYSNICKDVSFGNFINHKCSYTFHVFL